MKFRDYFQEQTFPKVSLKATLNASAKRKINNDIHKFLKKEGEQGLYFKEIPLGDLMEICENHGVVVIAEDYTRWSGFLTGADGHVYFDLADKNSATEYGRAVVYTSVFKNARLSLMWHKMPSGRTYEITTYVG